MTSPEDARLAALSKELDAAVARINALQGGGNNGAAAAAAAGADSSSSKQAVTAAARPTSTSSSPSTPLRARASSHFARHGGRLTSALLAGCAFAVAAGRLADARERREAEAAWQEERAELEGRAEAAEAALREAMERMRGTPGGISGGGEGSGEAEGGGGSGSWSSWLLPFSSSSATRRERGGSESSSPPAPPPPPPPRPRMI